MEINRENLLHLVRTELASRKMSISALEKQAGVPKDTVRDFLRGKTQVLRADKLQKIMHVLQPEKKIVISGRVGSEAEIFPAQPGIAADMDPPPGYNPADISAVLVTGDAMMPVFHDGWIVYYTRKAGDETPLEPKEGWQVPYNKPAKGESFSEFINKPCIIKLKDGRLFLRTLKQGSRPSFYNLTCYNGTDMLDVAVEWAAKIVFIKT